MRNPVSPWVVSKSRRRFAAVSTSSTRFARRPGPALRLNVASDIDLPCPLLPAAGYQSQDHPPIPTHPPQMCQPESSPLSHRLRHQRTTNEQKLSVLQFT
jgi:hypothetical protein